MAFQPFLIISVRDSGGLERLRSTMPQAIDEALAQIVGTLKAKVQGATPVGIRYQSYGKTKTGKTITRAGKKAKDGAEHRIGFRYRGKWVASGELKKSWQEFASSQGNAQAVGVSTDTPYAHILEGGKYKGIGKQRFGLMAGGIAQVSPRTVAGPGGVFSSRAPGGILKPILDNENWRNRVVQTIADRIFARFKAA